jgi:hypothetical protein
MQGKVSI